MLHGNGLLTEIVELDSRNEGLNDAEFRPVRRAPRPQARLTRGPSSTSRIKARLRQSGPAGVPYLPSSFHR